MDSINERPNFNDWKAIKSDALLQSAISETENGKLKVEFRLWDAMASTQLQGQSFTTTKENWRRLAHMIADNIYERLTGEKGYFDTRIVYVSESGPATRRVKRLALMDQDGENHKFLTELNTDYNKKIIKIEKNQENLDKLKEKYEKIKSHQKLIIRRN